MAHATRRTPIRQAEVWSNDLQLIIGIDLRRLNNGEGHLMRTAQLVAS